MKNSWKKLALVGMTGMLLSGISGISYGQEQDYGFKDSPQVVAAMSAIQEQVKFIEDFGITKGLNYTLTYDTPTEAEQREAVSAANVFNEKYCDVTVGLNSDGASSMTSPEYRQFIDDALAYTEEEKLMLAKTFAGHEIAHCRLVKIKNPFQVDNPHANKIINEVYGNTLTRGLIDINGAQKINFGLGDFLNESYADGMAFATMIKASHGDVKVSDFFKKVSANRELQTLKITEAGVMSKSQIDAYDLKMATAGLNTPENIKRILEAQTVSDLDQIVLENANKNVFNSLSSRSLEDLKKSMGVEALHQQAINYSVLSTVHLDKNSLVAQSIEYAKSKLSTEDRNLMDSSIAVMASTNFSKMNEAVKALKGLQEKIKEPLKEFLLSKENKIENAIETIHQESLKYKDDNRLDFSLAKKEYKEEFTKETNFVTNLALDVENTRKEHFKQEKHKKTIGVKF